MTLNHLVVGSSPTRVTLKKPAREGGSGASDHHFGDLVVRSGVAEASCLSGYDDAVLRGMIDDGAVGTNAEGFIAQDSLREYQETLLEMLQGKRS